MKTLVEAIRSDPLVGRGTCSSIDECMEDEHILRFLADAGIQTVEGAIRWARDGEEWWLDRGTNMSSGEPNCPLVAAYTEFVARRAALEKE